ncbi:hypothetical protein ACEZDB_35900 [Streptacidiphilus sp. N1-3]|uniref:FtsK domain-containing protein n=1 Tax=Streptacidiphilus alkalitolerans TaxID=3342712 RepID=A0ABV6XCN7_9ACTN
MSTEITPFEGARSNATGRNTGGLMLRAARGTYRRAHRHRRHLPPLAGSFALACYGQALTAAPHGTLGAVGLDLALPVAVVGWRRWRAKQPYQSRYAQFLERHRMLPTPPSAKRKPMTRGEVIRVSVAAAGAGTMVTLMPILHDGAFQPPMTGWWAAGTLACAVPWWFRRRIRGAGPTVSGQDPRVERWEERVGSARGVLAGSRLGEPLDRPEAGAWEAVIQLDSGRQTADQAIAATALIASAYDLPVTSIAIEKAPSGITSQARFLVFEKNPLKNVPVFPGPSALDTKTGIATLGLHIDGSPGLYQMWRPGWGAVHTHISGATGAGKSALLRSLFAIERHSGLITSWGGDPQEGKSFGFWQDYLSYFAPGIDECMGMLIAADIELTRRSKASAVSIWYDADGDKMYGDTDWTPTPEEPLIVVTIDEWQDVWGTYPEALELAVRIAILGRKVGIKLRLVTHLPTLESLGSERLRQPLTAGNSIAFRTTARSAGYVVNLPADPNDIPAVWPPEGDDDTSMLGLPTSGMGYLKGPQERAAMFRGWAPEKSSIATRWAKTGTPAEIPTEAAKEIGPLYTQWRDRLEARRRGELPEVPGVTDTDVDLDDEGEEKEKPKKRSTGGKTRTGAGPVIKAAAMPSFGATPAAAGADFEKLLAASNAPARGEKKRQIIAYLHEHGESTTGIIADRTGIAMSTVSSTLVRAAKNREIADLGHGKWGPITVAA